MSTSIPVAVLGATGYAGEGAVKILLGHPHFDLVHVGSDRLAGQRLDTVVPELSQQCDLVLASDDPETLLASQAQAIILCKKSPEVTAIVPQLLQRGLRVVDVGAEFRLRRLSDYQRYYGDAHCCPDLLPTAVYGLTELNRSAIVDAQVIGNPGCYPTALLLPLLPLLKEGLLDAEQDITAVGYSGVSGAGKRFVEANNNLFYAMSGNLHSYRALDHQHRAEIDQESSIAAGRDLHIRFIPHLAPLVRGIHMTITASLAPGVGIERLQDCWTQQYSDSRFVRVRQQCRMVEVAHVAGSNFCDIAAEVDADKLVITAAIDNLIKGASGQAVQNLNIMFGFPEWRGLLQRGI